MGTQEIGRMSQSKGQCAAQRVHMWLLLLAKGLWMVNTASVG